MNHHPIAKSCGTHDGSFHADEVTACALLALFNLIDEDKIVRTRDPKVLARCEYVCDVGGIYDPAQKLFDHHQIDYKGSMSSAGMILLYLKEIGRLDADEYAWFNRTIIMGVDAHDNGLGPLIPGHSSFSDVVSNFAPIHQGSPPEEQNAAFHEAFRFVMGHLQRLRKRYAYIHSCREIIVKLMAEKKPYLLFDQNIPWLELFFELDGKNHPAKFIIMPSGNHWKLRAIPPSFEDRMNVRVPLPLEWAGLSNGELKSISGIDGAIFCHKGRFFSVWETLEDAKKALEYTLKKETA